VRKQKKKNTKGNWGSGGVQENHKVENRSLRGGVQMFDWGNSLTVRKRDLQEKGEKGWQRGKGLP